MEEFADLNAILNLTKTPEEISPVERLLNEFEAHEAREAESHRLLQKDPEPHAQLGYALLDAADRFG